MTNHVHLLVTPLASGAVSHMMQEVGRRYVRIFNEIDRLNPFGLLVGLTGLAMFAMQGAAWLILRTVKLEPGPPRSIALICAGVRP